MMTSERLAEIRERQPPGSWVWSVSSDRRWAEVVTNASGRDDADRTVARCADDDDAEFIAHAPADIVWLLAAYDEQRAEVDRLRAQVAAVRDLLPDEDDPYVHVHPEGEGDPDCGGCWNADLLRILA